MLKITFSDDDLEELITTGKNSGKYEKLARKLNNTHYGNKK